MSILTVALDLFYAFCLTLPNIGQPDREGVLPGVWEGTIYQSPLDQLAYPWNWIFRVNVTHILYNHNDTPSSNKWYNQQQDTLQVYVINNSLERTHLWPCR